MSNYTRESEMTQLLRRAQAGDRRCLNRLMRQHDGLVHHIIRQQWDGPLTYAETLQEGRIALWRAILGLVDPGRGTAFSTYASVAIARQVWQAVERAQQEQQGGLIFPDAFAHLLSRLPQITIGELVSDSAISYAPCLNPIYNAGVTPTVDIRHDETDEDEDTCIPSRSTQQPSRLSPTTSLSYSLSSSQR